MFLESTPSRNLLVYCHHKVSRCGHQCACYSLHFHVSDVMEIRIQSQCVSSTALFQPASFAETLDVPYLGITMHRGKGVYEAGLQWSRIAETAQA